MNCSRCQNCYGRPEDMDENLSTNGPCQSDQVTSDIGGFAQLAGCLDKLKKSEQQVGHFYN